MTLDDSQSRRRILKLSGAAAVPAVLAGCGGGGSGEENGGGNGGNESGNGGGGEPLEPGEIELGGETSAWQGVAPDQIADQENPTLTLQEGESYEITWENLDGQGHNLQIRDDSDEVVEDYETEIMEEEGETQTLEVDEVTSEMTQYVCEPHSGSMVGDIEVQ
ncbi:plastocyanin/azurin family copper-binding protein [Natronorubrum sp. FCH18a]|uniref:plastocyanin/azurin family copper-binding protein n=1 Tax=Natronorubrum sp. FCH18a TaxID=3447018 RepID=UPI003F51776F